jgi:O-acetyl-ADP-ribose deacetylase (regulator of RNase III)
VWQGGRASEAELLTSAYQACLNVATEHHLTSISFPSISTGAYRYPVAKAAPVALQAVASFLMHEQTSVQEVGFVLFDARTYQQYSAALELLAAKL